MKRIVTMQDLSCLGKCSLSVMLPALSAMGIECAVLPTAVLSTHTAFPAPAVNGLTDFAFRTLEHWQTIGARFDGILTGYLADPEQVSLARALNARFGGEQTLRITDPAMGDHGRLYAGLSPDMIPAMADLCAGSDLCLPNLTEAALMTGMPCEDRADIGYCRELGREMLGLGPGSVMLTGAEHTPGQVGWYFTDGKTEAFGGVEKLPRSCHGTGDLFAAVVSGGLLLGMAPAEAGQLAAEFIRRCIAATGADSRWGVAFEGELGWLMEHCGSRR